jgi:hypothetical protein
MLNVAWATYQSVTTTYLQSHLDEHAFRHHNRHAEGRGVFNAFLNRIEKSAEEGAVGNCPSKTSLYGAAILCRSSPLRGRVRVSEVMVGMKRPHGKLGPQPATVEELPLPPARKPKDMPSADELIKSDKKKVS